MGKHAFNEPAIKEVATDTYTLLADDSGKVLKFTHASGCAVSAPAGLTKGWNAALFGLLGNVVVTAASGVDLNGTDGAVKTMASGYAPATILALADDDLAISGNLS